MSAPSVELAVVTQHPSFGGGATALTREFTEAAHALGHRTRVLYPPYVRLLDSLNQVACASQIGRQARKAEGVWVVAAAASYGYGALRSGGPYDVWVATVLEDEWAARRPSLPRSRRIALAANAPLLRRLEQAVVRNARRVFATSEPTRASLVGSTGAAAGRIEVLPVPVDTALFRPEPDDRWLARLDRPTVVFVGRADDPRKNVGLLIDAWPHISARLPGARLRLVGSPPARRLPDGVECAGAVASVADELRSAALLVLPSLQEGFGIVVAEALASGVPVVVTPSGGPEDLVAASGGGRVTSGFTAEELCATITALLTNEDELRAMRVAGRAHVELELSRRAFQARLKEILASSK
jgi:glycosyltransferase involved in cell wall biosynthesis